MTPATSTVATWLTKKSKNEKIFFALSLLFPFCVYMMDVVGGFTFSFSSSFFHLISFFLPPP